MKEPGLQGGLLGGGDSETVMRGRVSISIVEAGEECFRWEGSPMSECCRA